ncbi:MAG: UvrD-helicase domain-containing protein, partial [Bryobacteraceae bacterium]
MNPSPASRRVALTGTQLDAVTRDGQDVCVIAGPGSGKTTVLIERYAWLVETQGIEADRILAVTFTEKAATEIRKRLIQRFDAAPEIREQVERAWVSTIDGFCARLLREYAIAAELPPDFQVLDAPAADQLQREATDRALDLLLAKNPPRFRELLLALAFPTRDDGRQQDLARGLRDVYEAVRISGVASIPGAASTQDAIREFRRETVAAISVPAAASGGSAAPQVLAWCRDLLLLPDTAVDDHLRMIAILKVNLTALKSGSALRNFAKRARDEWAGPLLEQRNAHLAPLLHEALEGIHLAYRAAKRARGAVDFGDLEEGAIRLL